MADENTDGDLERSGQGWADEDTFYAMESLQATLQHLEAALRQRDISEASSTEYCDNFCQVKKKAKQKTRRSETANCFTHSSYRANVS